MSSILNCFGVGHKYRKESGTTVHGYPLNGNMAPNLTQEEYDSLPLGLNVKVRIFDLSKPEDMEAYTVARDQIANKKCVQLDRTKLVSEDGREIRIHLEWADVEGYVPKTLQRRL